VSLILDALRRRPPGRPPGTSSDTSRAKFVLKALGYSPRHTRVRVRRRPRRRIGWYGVAALFVGFAGLSLLIATLAPARSGALAQGSPAAAAPARGAPASPAPIEYPRLAPAQSSGTIERDQPPSSGAPDEAAPSAETVANAQSMADEAARPVLSAAADAAGDSPRPVPPPSKPLRAEPRFPAAGPPDTPLTSVTSITSVTSPGAKRPEPAAPSKPDTPSTQVVRIDHFALALYYQRIGNFDDAVPHYRALLEANDASAEVHNNLGLLYQDRGQIDDAMKQFEQAIAIDPASVRAHNNLGVALLRAGRLDAAGAELRVALAAEPRNVESIVNLALVEKAAGRTADARDLLLRAVAVDPASPGAHYNLAVLADEAGDAAIAIEEYRAFLKLGGVPHGDLVTPVRARLTALGG
jgi:Tfp pilus assembly protein PilF